MVIPLAMEKDLATHIILLADTFHGVSVTKCCAIAHDFAIANNLKVPQSWARDKKAGQDWWHGFKKRHDLTTWKPEATSYFQRAIAVKRRMFDVFYNNLAKVMDENKFEPSSIFNCDETGVTTAQKPKEVVTARGKKQVGSLTSGERGELVTVSAAGQVLPPLFIFPRVNYRDHFIIDAPPGLIG
jgi:hypothetical protein